MVQFLRRKRKAAGPERESAGRMGAVLGKALQKAQVHLASILSEREKRMSIRQKKRALWSFCIGMSILSSWWICQGIFPYAPGKPTYLKHQAITAPQKTQLPDSLDLRLLKQFQHGQAKKDSLPDSLK